MPTRRSTGLVATLLACGLSVMILRLSAEERGAVELGRVAWLRNYDQACSQSKESGKPVLPLF
jgi:hypothetical protein